MAPVPASTDVSSIFSVLRRSRALYAPMLGIAAFGLVACSGKPENSPVIRKKFAEVDAMKEDLSSAVADLRAATGEITLLREQVSELRAFAPDGEGSTAVISRIDAIENRLAALTSSQSQARTVAQSSEGSSSSSAPSGSGSGSSGSASSSFGGLATPATGSSSAATSTSADSFRRLTNPTTGTTSGSSSTPARSETAAAAPRTTTPAQTGTGASVPSTQGQANRSQANRGRYHTIETGDTLEKLARDNNISVEALREANRLPAGARPLRGQRLFIPPARQ